MFLLHMAQPSRDIYQDQPVGWRGQSTRATVVGHSHPSPVPSISLVWGGHFIPGWDLVQNPDLTFLHQASFPSKNPVCWGTFKKRARSNSGRMGITSQLAAWESKARKMAGSTAHPPPEENSGKHGNSKRPSQNCGNKENLPPFSWQQLLF